MEEDEKEEKNLRNTIPYGKRLRNNLSKEKKDIRARSSSQYQGLYKNFIPKLKPIICNLNPSPIKLGEKELIEIDKEYFILSTKKKSNKKFLFNINNIEEELYENVVNSGDEQYNNKLSDTSYSSENELKNNDKMDNNIKIKKDINNYINYKRRSLEKVKNKIEIKKIKDDTNILRTSYEKSTIENFRVKCAQNYIDKLKLEKMEEYEKFKNKTISFKDIKKLNPPILGFLQMNEESRSSTLSSFNISEI